MRPGKTNAIILKIPLVALNLLRKGMPLTFVCVNYITFFYNTAIVTRKN